MRLLTRRGFAVAASAGILALGLTACGSVTPDTTGTTEIATTDIEAETTNLGCDDLGDQVWSLAPDPDMALDEMPEADFAALATWMVDNGPEFEDPELGAAVVEWGTLGAGYHDQGGEALNEEDIATFEAASTTIDATCSGLGFGFQQ